jgi:hypothetical protein
MLNRIDRPPPNWRLAGLYAKIKPPNRENIQELLSMLVEPKMVILFATICF